LKAISVGSMNGPNVLLVSNNNLVPDPNQEVMGMELPRHVWSVLNRICAGHGCCADMMYKW